MSQQIKSDGDDCGLEGKEDAPVLTGPLNRFMRRTRHIHIDPLHRGQVDHEVRISSMEDTIVKVGAKFDGFFIAVKLFGVLMIGAFTGGVIFAVNLWQKINSLPGAQ